MPPRCRQGKRDGGLVLAYVGGCVCFLPRCRTLALRYVVIIEIPPRMYRTVKSLEASVDGARSPNPTVATATVLK